ncbi:MAG: aminotransferase class IV [Bacteroidales bacterium]|nr:aminotransferase class IV [Bacteroidales bacterium]
MFINDAIGTHLIVNDSVIESKLSTNIDLSQTSVYEVIRIIDSVPLYLEDHLERLFTSISLLGLSTSWQICEITDKISNLLYANNIINGNIKLIISFYPDQELFLVYQIKHAYPTPELYSNGISTSVLFAERKNPNAKQFQSVRELAQKTIIQRSVYEVVLVNEKKNITEGSKSNLFFILDNNLITAKAEEVLKGITRKYVIAAAQNIGMKIYERSISLSELNSFEAAFISGTSPKILPIQNIDQYNYQIENLKLRLLMNEFNSLIDNYIKKKTFNF